MSNRYFKRFCQSVFPVLLCLLVAVLGAGCPGEQGPEGPDGPPGPGQAFDPGLNITIESITIPADLRPEIVFTATDDGGSEIALGEFTDIRFMLAYLEGSGITPADNELSPRLVSYTLSSRGGSLKPTYDSSGRFRGLDDPGGATQNSDGTISYKFAATLPAGYDAAAMHQLAGQMARTFLGDGKSYKVNHIHRFVPNGAPVTETREIVNTETCNACHTRLEIHGSRREIQYCIMCHNDQITDESDPSNSADFQNLIHRIHMGEDMPIPGYFDAEFDGVAFPQDIRNCESCHQGAPDADVWKERPSRAACGSCHNDVWFGDMDALPEGMVKHADPIINGGLEQIDDLACHICHPSEVIENTHKRPVDEDEAPGLALDILSVDTALVPLPAKAEGDVAVTIVLSAEDKLGAPYTDLSTFSRLRARIAYPAPEYQEYFYEDLLSVDPLAELINNNDGTYDYTFAMQLPGDSTDTYAVGLEGRVLFDLNGEEERQGTSSNGLTFFTVDGSDPIPRRIIVTDEKCNACHGEIRMHGDSRFGVDYCVMCHNPNKSGENDFTGEPVTVNFKDMIHSIHTGHDLENPYAVGDHDYNELHFPGERRKCSICHVEDNPGTRNDDEDTFDLPLPEEALSTVLEEEVEEDVFEHVWTKEPIRAACISCHDSIWTDIHALLGTDLESGVETCIVCHGEGKDFDVEVVHEMEP